MNQMINNTAVLNAQRSLFKIPHRLTTTFNAGDLIPIFCKEVLPGDTWSCDTAAVVREIALKSPVMDNSYLDVFAFFVPNRIIWNSWKQFCGENDTSAWTRTTTKTMPKVYAAGTVAGIIGSNTLGDYFGLPVGVAGLNINSLPLRGYIDIWNNWFRNQNVQAPIIFGKGDTDSFAAPFAISIYNTAPLKANRFKDLFTSCLPDPQKGPDVQIPFANSSKATVKLDSTSVNTPYHVFSGTGSTPGSATYSSISGSTINYYLGSSGRYPKLDPNGTLYADLTSCSVLVNELRYAIATQRLYERNARSGTLYQNYLHAGFGVNPPDAAMGIPQYLGGTRIPLSVEQVKSTSESYASGATTPSSYVGEVAATSQTGLKFHQFTYSAYEHGLIYILACVRTDNTYSQGLDKYWTKTDLLDFYDPVFSHIGEVGVKCSEINYQNDSTADDAIFGYQEAWYEYHYFPNQLTGLMRPGVSGSLGSYWTYGREFSGNVVLNESFIEQTATEVDRTLSVGSAAAGSQLLGDFYFDFKVSRVMPVKCVPGLMDHF